MFRHYPTIRRAWQSPRRKAMKGGTRQHLWGTPSAAALVPRSRRGLQIPAAKPRAAAAAGPRAVLEPPGAFPRRAAAVRRSEAQSRGPGKDTRGRQRPAVLPDTGSSRTPSKTRFMCTLYSLRFICRERICPALLGSPKRPHHTSAPGKSAPAPSHRRTQRCRSLEGDPAMTPGISARGGTTLLT